MMVNNSTVNAKKKEQLIDRDIACNERMVIIVQLMRRRRNN